VSDWTDGYISEIGYTFSYFSELNPLHAVLPFLNVGLSAPPIATACELGYGQGISVNIHAAASDVLWYGTDFNPGHAAFAQSLADAAGTDARLFDQSFAEFCARSDLPDFDYIALHGVWGWVSRENEQVIVDFIRKKLKVGGLLYISYNCQPGHAAILPLRHLFTEHAAIMAAPGQGIVARIDAALDFAEKLLGLNPGFAVVNPTIGERLKRTHQPPPVLYWVSIEPKSHPPPLIVGQRHLPWPGVTAGAPPDADTGQSIQVDRPGPEDDTLTELRVPNRQLVA